MPVLEVKRVCEFHSNAAYVWLETDQTTEEVLAATKIKKKLDRPLSQEEPPSFSPRFILGHRRQSGGQTIRPASQMGTPGVAQLTSTSPPPGPWSS